MKHMEFCDATLVSKDGDISGVAKRDRGRNKHKSLSLILDFLMLGFGMKNSISNTRDIDRRHLPFVENMQVKR